MTMADGYNGHGDERNGGRSASADRSGGTQASVRTPGDKGYGLSDEQEEAIAILANAKDYSKQSRWQTFIHLPRDQRWSYFVQQYLLAVVIIGAILAFAIAVGVTVLTRDPDPELSVSSLDVDYSKTLEKVRRGFVAERKIDDERLVRFDGSLTIDASGKNTMDDSISALAQVSAGSINGIVTDSDSLRIAVHRRYVGRLKQTLGADALDGTKDAWLDGKGQPTDDAAKAVALDLSKSKVWNRDGGSGDDPAVLAVSNVTDETAKQRMIELIDYLY